MSFDRTNSFALGKGDKDKPEHQDKDTSKWPDYKGHLNVDGKEYFLSGWVRENAETGEKFISGAVKLKESKQEQPKPEFDDDIPF